MKIAVISDAWHPQINGIVTTLNKTAESLHKLGHETEFFTPDRYRTYKCPGYPSVGLAFLCGPNLRPQIEAFKPDAIHFATESSIGFAARRYCLEKGYRFTTAFHSRYPEYFKMRVGLPLWVSYSYLRWFHSESTRMMVSTETLRDELVGKGFNTNMAIWSRGVDTDLFQPGPKDTLNLPRPYFIYVGRVAVEKNIEDFLTLDLPGTKIVIGDGPQRSELESRYPKARFLGFLGGASLVKTLTSADVMVFPSRTDTYGLVILEALACGVPVAAFPEPGPLAIIGKAPVGIISNDLKQAALDALKLSPSNCRRHALNYSWEQSARQFVSNLTPMKPRGGQTHF